MSEKKFKYSEIFGNTFQGEGHYTGVPTVWIRFWGCNFECAGFGQENPEDSSTWKLDYKDIDPSKYNSMEDLPVFSRGCDSSYSWAKKFSHLSHSNTASEICDKIEQLLPGGKFLHPDSRQWQHLAFTGGEPMLAQTAIIEIMKEFDRRDNKPEYVTIETNGTQKPREEFISYFTEFRDYGAELFWSVSPKLYLSGEKWEKAIKPEVLADYHDLSEQGQIKYVSNGTDKSWEEVTKATALYREQDITWPVWIMAVGADKEMQENHQAKIAEEAMKRGYSFSARVHVFVFGNIIGK